MMDIKVFPAGRKMESNKYFFNGAIGLVFGQAIGFLILILLSIFPFMSRGHELLPILQLIVMWGIFGGYIGILWNKTLETGIIGVISGTIVGFVWYSILNPPTSIWGTVYFLPGILFVFLFLVCVSLNNNITIKTAFFLLVGISLSVILSSLFLKYAAVLGNKFTGVIPPLIGFFSFVFSLIILGGLIGIGFYYALGSSSDVNKNGFKNTFLKLGKIVSFIWIFFMFIFALGASNDPGYSVTKVNETENFVVLEAGEINRFPYFTKAISEIEKGEKGSYTSSTVPREEWNTLRDFIDEKCRLKGISGSCFIKINDSFYKVSFYTP